MALINTLREKMGKVLVVVIFIAILSFVLADFVGSNSRLFGENTDVGEIGGETISNEEYQQVLSEVESRYVMNFRRTPTENERPTLRQQAWDLLVVKHAFEKQYEAVGITVTEDEIWDMMQGKNISPSIKQSFVNPTTGQFDRQSFIRYYNQVPSMPPQAQAQWQLFEADLEPGRKRLKYENLLVSTNFASSLEAQKAYADENNIADVKYLYVPFYAISDSTITVSDSEINQYYNENKERYKTDGTRSLKYMSFSIQPSKEDTTYFQEELEDVKQEFLAAKDDSVYAAISSDNELSFFGNYHLGILPQELKNNVSDLAPGNVYGPYLDATGVFKLYKVSDIYEDTVEYAKSSHILFGDGDEAKSEANRILREIKNGADFAEMASTYGTDATKTKGGDLGWNKRSGFVDEFSDAVFGRSTPGLVNSVVKTKYGYHIVKVDEAKTNTAYKVATIERNITPSDETINNVYRTADLFASEVSSLEEFEAQGKEKGYTVSPEQSLKKNDQRIGVLGNAREAIRWLFRDASVGDVSDVIELDGQYIIVAMTGEVPEGYTPVDKLKTEITVKVKNEAKGKQLVEKLKGLSGSLDEIAASFGDDANVYATSDLKLNTSSVPNVGFDPLAIGKAFSLESGQTSEPFASENGVFIMEMINKTVAPEVADYSTYKTQLEQTMKNQSSYGVAEAIKKNADITDKRYKFY